jgi:hypothetical protein
MPTRPKNNVIDHLRRAVLCDSAGAGDGELLDCFIDCYDEAAFAALSTLATGKLELEIKAGPPAAPEKK